MNPLEPRMGTTVLVERLEAYRGELGGRRDAGDSATL